MIKTTDVWISLMAKWMCPKHQYIDNVTTLRCHIKAEDVSPSLDKESNLHQHFIYQMFWDSFFCSKSHLNSYELALLIVHHYHDHHYHDHQYQWSSLSVIIITSDRVCKLFVQDGQSSREKLFTKVGRSQKPPRNAKTLCSWSSSAQCDDHHQHNDDYLQRNDDHLQHNDDHL